MSATISKSEVEDLPVDSGYVVLVADKERAFLGQIMPEDQNGERIRVVAEIINDQVN